MRTRVGVPGDRHISEGTIPKPGIRSSGSASERAITEARKQATERGVGNTWIPTYRRQAIAVDAIVSAAMVSLALFLGSLIGAGHLSAALTALALVAAPVVWTCALWQAGAYDTRDLGVGSPEYAAIPRAVLRVLALTAITTLPFDNLHDAIRLIAIALPVIMIGSLVARYCHRQRLHRARTRRGLAMQRTIVLGASEAVAHLVQDMRLDPSRGLQPVAACTSEPHLPIQGLKVERHLSNTLETIEEVDPDVVVVAHPSDLTPHELRRLSWALEQRDIELMVSPGIMEVAGPRLSIRPSASLSLVHVERPKATGGNLIGKRVLDLVGATLLVTLILPVFALITLAVKVQSRGPVIFRQSRVGASGEHFTMLKFRSMVVDAEKQLDVVRTTADAGNDVLFKRTDDPRITRVGRTLRRYSLDELPQLFNVIRGDMSLVGPRPPLPSEVATYEADAVRRLRVRPGLTGLWQVSGRSDLSWDESLRLDLRYVDNWSVMFDLQILWRTARAVVRGEGAY